MLRLFRRADPRREAGRTLYEGIAKQARLADFYTRFAVPDTLDGRFDLLALHAFLVMEVLKGTGKTGDGIGTHLATSIFESLEEALRDLGVGDMGISRRIKAMANAFYGRLSVYSAAQDEAEMRDALIRNLYRGAVGHEAEASLLAQYVVRALKKLRTPDAIAALSRGEVAFVALPKN